MSANRRDFLRDLTLGTVGAGVIATSLNAADRSASAGFLAKEPSMKLGMVTYQLGQDWSLDTIIKNCEAAAFQGVELRTSHKHGVEVTLSKEERERVKSVFNDSKVELMGLGSAFDYHTPDADKLKKDIAVTKEYIKLAHDVGAPGVKVRPNGFPTGVEKEKTLEQIGRSLRELGEFGDSYGIQLRLEVHGTGTSLLPNIRRVIDIADHKMVGVCWNSNQSDLEGEGFDSNFNLVKDKIFSVHMRDLYLQEYPFRRLLNRLNEIAFRGYCLAEIPSSADPVRVMRYFRGLWLAYQNLL